MSGFRHKLFFVFIYGGLLIIGIIGLPTFLLPRRALLEIMRVWSRFARWCLKVFYGVESEIRGAQYLPKGPCLIAMKHQSTYDTAFPLLWLDQPIYVMKRELRKAPVYGLYCMKWGMISIDRASGIAAIKAICRHAKQTIALGRQLVIFPEGTRRAPGAPPRYLSGIAALYLDLGIPCIPIANNSGLYWPATDAAKANLAGKPSPDKPRRIVFEVLPPIEPGLERRQFMQVLRDRIEPASTALLPDHIKADLVDSESAQT